VFKIFRAQSRKKSGRMFVAKKGPVISTEGKIVQFGHEVGEKEVGKDFSLKSSVR